MKTPLHFPLIYTVVLDRKKYRLDPYFDNVLKVFAIQKESELPESEKINLSLRLLIKCKINLSYNKKITLLNKIFDALIDSSNGNDNPPQIIDFEQDSGYIFSSFYSEYGIDLYQEQGNLHWWKFLHLFQGLSDNTKIVQVMQIRARPLPIPTKHNSEERINLIKLKQQYSLCLSKETTEKNFANGLKKLANIMQNMTCKGGM